MVCIAIPDDCFTEIKQKSLPSGWFVNPPPDSLKLYGDKFIRENKYFALKIPSAIMPEENNFLLNPNHPNFKKIKVEYVRKVSVDNRLSKK